MRILLTGANGQLGEALQRLLGVCAVPTDAETLDITKPICFSEPIDAIINCAAYTNVDGAEDAPNAAYAVNALGAKHLAAFAAEKQIPLVHVSTDYVFDGTQNTPYTEDFPICPQSVYGSTKAAGEAFVRAYAKHYIVRTAWLYGRQGKNFVKTILKNAAEKGALRVVSDQIGCPTNADDLAKQILALLESEKYGTYHCTGSGACSWYDFAVEIVRLSGIPCTVTPCKTGEFPARAKRPAYSVLNNSKAERATGFIMPKWQDSLKTFMREDLHLC